MINSFICFLLYFLLNVMVASTSASQHIQPENVSFNDVHIWNESICYICHLSTSPEKAPLNMIDQSALCESCHKETVTILSNNIIKSRVHKMNNHPIKFSPFDFSPDKINQNIVKEGQYYYVLGQTGKVPLFGDTMESAVAECGTCHEPHGKLIRKKLLQVDNSEGKLCLICHKGDF